MKNRHFFPLIAIISLFVFASCNQQGAEQNTTSNDTTVEESPASQVHDSSGNAGRYGGFKSEVAWGGHLVQIVGCNDCHTPKKMTATGPVPDMSLMLSGHPAKMPAPDVNRKEMESKGLAVTNDLTAWVGPWGISYAANLTPDGTGIGNWDYTQFERAIRQGKFMGSENGRQLLPPMPWQEFSNMTDGELRAIFAYLKSIKPIHNLVPAAEPPASAQTH